MWRTVIISVIVLAIAGLTTCQKSASSNEATKPLFDSIPIVITINPTVNEVSGIADSKKNAGYLWAMEDSGNPTQLYLINHNGAVAKKLYISNSANRDWEEMALSGNDVYLADIGDNNEMYSSYTIYKFPEPSASVDTVRRVEAYSFTYPDGPHDAEAFFVEASTGNIYIVTKRDNPSRIYKLTAPLSATNTATFIGRLNYSGVVAAAISPDDKEIIIKTYFGLGYYKKADGEAIEATLQRPPVLLPYIAEPQGEAVCFSATNNGYFTLSEKGFASDVKLYFYKRY